MYVILLLEAAALRPAVRLYRAARCDAHHEAFESAAAYGRLSTIIAAIEVGFLRRRPGNLSRHNALEKR